MHIVQLSAENVKRLKAVEITPDGPVQIVAGRNAQGKSSVLDAIWMALEWKAAGKATTRPIRDGEDRARVRLDLGDLVVTRTWAGDKTSLLVEAADGTPQQRPQELLDSLVGRLSFDPLLFIGQGAREQVSTLLSVVELPFDLDAMDRQRQELYDKRHLVGQDVTRARGAFETMPPMASNGLPYEDLPAEPISTRDLLDEYQEIQDEIQRHNDTRKDLDAAEREHDLAADALKAAQERLNAALEARTAARKAVDRLGEAPSVGPVKEALAAAEATNQAIREGVAFRAARQTWNERQAEWDGLDDQIKDLDRQKADGLAQAVFPIEGLGFDDTGVVYNGVPFGQASSAEQLKVSLAIAMALNPTLRVIRITDGSLLDGDNLAMIGQMATDHDFQVWVERVDETGTAGVVIEDGKVA